MSDTCSKPFDLPSGCETISVPPLTVPPICSFPSVTSPGVSPNPAVFNIPELPNIPIEQACIDINPSVSALLSIKDGDLVASGKFSTAIGFDDCLEGRYNLGIKLNIPCILDRIPSSVNSEGKWSGGGGDAPAIGMSLKKSDFECGFKKLTFNLRVPCPVTGFSVKADQKTYSRTDHPKANLRIPKKPGVGVCELDIRKISLVLDIPPGCGGMSFTSPETKVGVRKKNTGPSVHVGLVREGDDFGGSKPEACKFNVSMNLQIPPGCHNASYYVAPKVTMNSSPSIYAKVSKVKGREDECAFNLSFALGLPTGALSPCLSAKLSGGVNDLDANRKFASLFGRLSRPSRKPDDEGSPCDIALLFDLELPRILVEPNFNIDMGDVDINVNNGPDININNNIRSFSIDIRMPKLVCLPKEVLTLSRVQMKFFKDNHIASRFWRHVSVSQASCVKKKVRKYPGKISAKPQYTMTCVTQCSRTVNVSMKLPWWMYRGNTKNNGKRTIEYVRAQFLRDIGRRGARAVGDGGPDDQQEQEPKCPDYMGRISIRASLNDFEEDPGSADISVWITLPCPGDTISMHVNSTDGSSPDFKLSVLRGDCCSVVFNLGMPFTGLNTCVTRYANFFLRSTGFFAYAYRDCYVKGILKTVSRIGTVKLFAANGCN